MEASGADRVARADVDQMPRVFISYRRDDTGQAAAALGLLLGTHLSSEVVFLDHSDLEWGRRWRDQLETAITDRDVLLCLIGRGWEGAASNGELRRIDHVDDPVRREIALAIGLGVQVLPVAVDRSTIPKSLPDDLAPLLTQQFAPLRSTDYDADFAVILARLWQVRLGRTDGAQVVLTVGGTHEVDAEQFLRTISHRYPPEVNFVTAAATARMSVTMAEVRDAAPHLYIVLSSDADERDRRVVAVFAAHWEQVVIVAVGVPAGYTVAQLFSESGREWLTEAVGGAVERSADVLSMAGSASDGSIGAVESSTRGAIRVVRRAIAARPRAALIAGALAVGGSGAVAYRAATGGGSEPLAQGATISLVLETDDAETSRINPSEDVPFEGPGPTPLVLRQLTETCAPNPPDDVDVLLHCDQHLVLDGPSFLAGETLGVPGSKLTWSMPFGPGPVRDDVLAWVGIDGDLCETDPPDAWEFVLAIQPTPFDEVGTFFAEAVMPSDASVDERSCVWKIQVAGTFVAG